MIEWNSLRFPSFFLFFFLFISCCVWYLLARWWYLIAGGIFISWYVLSIRMSVRIVKSKHLSHNFDACYHIFWEANNNNNFQLLCKLTCRNKKLYQMLSRFIEFLGRIKLLSSHNIACKSFWTTIVETKSFKNPSFRRLVVILNI